MPEERIQKVLAAAGVASRRQAEVLVGSGRVRIDGVVATVGQKVDPARSTIDVDGSPVGFGTARAYVALHKPAGVDVDDARSARRHDGARSRADRARARRHAALPGRAARPRLGGPAAPHQRRRLGRARAAPALRRRAGVRARPRAAAHARAGSADECRHPPRGGPRASSPRHCGRRPQSRTASSPPRSTRRPTRGSCGTARPSPRAGSASSAGCSARSMLRSFGSCAFASASSASATFAQVASRNLKAPEVKGLAALGGRAAMAGKAATLAGTPRGRSSGSGGPQTGRTPGSRPNSPPSSRAGRDANGSIKRSGQPGQSGPRRDYPKGITGEPKIRSRAEQRAERERADQARVRRPRRSPPEFATA